VRSRFPNRKAAGQALAREVATRIDPSEDVLVLGLPRGGVPVAAEVAAVLGASLDVFVVRKLGVPGHEELAMGALAGDGTVVINHAVVDRLGITEATIDRVVDEERYEVDRRQHAYRGDRPPVDIAVRTVIIVDDGLATGATMRAAVDAVRAQQPQRIVVAVPVAPPAAVDALRDVVDDVVAVATPMSFLAVGEAYEDFTQTTDDEVRALLSRP